MSNLTDPHFHDTKAARRYLENLRWPDGPYCPHCGTVGSYKTKREGIYRCTAKECRKDFSVTVGTIFERSHIPLHKWLLGFRLMCGSKKGMSTHQLHRTLGVTYKTAWFMTHRIGESMREFSPGPVGGENKVVEADETFIGGKAKNRTLAIHRLRKPFSHWSNVRAASTPLMFRMSAPKYFATNSSDKWTESHIL